MLKFKRYSSLSIELICSHFFKPFNNLDMNIEQSRFPITNVLSQSRVFLYHSSPLIIELHDTLSIYTPHLEESFFNIVIPDPSTQLLDVTATYVSKITAELSRCTEEYKSRFEQCQRTANEIVNLWAQLDSNSSFSNSSMSSSVSSNVSLHFNPQSELDRLILDHHNNAPEKIGLKQDVLNKLAAKRDELLQEKQRRQAKIADLRGAIEPMWQKLGKDKKECDTFLRRNRGFSEKVIAAVYPLPFELMVV